MGEYGLTAALVARGLKGGAGRQVTGTWEISALLLSGGGVGWGGGGSLI